MILLLGLAAALLTGCGCGGRNIDVDSPEYTEAAAAFYTDRPRCRLDKTGTRKEKTIRVTELYPSTDPRHGAVSEYGLCRFADLPICRFDGLA